MGFMKKIWTGISRVKSVNLQRLHDTELKRCLNVIDVTGIGISSTLGIGVYILIAHVARDQAGPSVVISILIASVAALLSGLCYAEFAARLPRAGSSYLFSYVTFGELSAFVIGWNMVLENLIGAAVASKAWTQYLDNMMNNSIQKYIQERLPMSYSHGISSYPDLVSCSLIISVTCIICIGVRMTALVNLVLMAFNVVIVACIVCVGFFHVQSQNWTHPPGFFSYGSAGVMTGAASCFYAFISFDIIATSSEETKEPSKTIPMAIIATVSTCFALYFGIAVAVTLTFPWNKLEIEAPLARAYEARKIFGFEYVVGVGALFGLTAGLFAAMFPIPRILYSMGSDGLLFKFLAHVNAQSQTPLPACIISGVLAATVALIFRLDLLVELLSIGILAAYTLVSLAVLCLRYQNGIVGLYNEYEDPNDLETTVFAKETYDKTDTYVREGSRVLHVMDQHTFIRRNKEDDPLCNGRNGITTEIFMKHPDDLASKPIFESGMKRGSTYHRMNSLLSNSSLGSVLQMSGDAPTDPNDKTWRIVSYSLVAYIVSTVCICLLLTVGRPYLVDASWWAITLLCLLLLVVLVSIVFIAKQPQNNTKLYFKVPYVPFVPLTSLALNSLMIASLPQIAWVRFAIWMLIGLVIYFGYGIWKSVERNQDEEEVVLYEISEVETEQVLKTDY